MSEGIGAADRTTSAPQEGASESAAMKPRSSDFVCTCGSPLKAALITIPKSITTVILVCERSWRPKEECGQALKERIK